MRAPILALALLARPAAAQPYVPGESYGFYVSNPSRSSQQVLAIEYIAGDLPIVLVAPHGGTADPGWIPRRPPGSISFGVDAGSRQYTLLVAEQLRLETGRHPHVVINHLRSSRLNPTTSYEGSSRDYAEPTAPAVRAFCAFHELIDAAAQAVRGDWQEGIYLEMHTHAHPHQRTEIGMNVDVVAFDLDDAALDAAFAAELHARAGIRRLVLRRALAFSEFARGAASFGASLEARGYTAMPSPSRPGPAGEPMWDGSWGTLVHGSSLVTQYSELAPCRSVWDPAQNLDSLMIETHYSRTGRRTRPAYAAALGAAILDFVETHYGFALRTSGETNSLREPSRASAARSRR
jgi:hypothetical protein